MHGCVIGELVNGIDARRELVGVHILPHLIEPRARIDRQTIRHSPFILKINAGEVASLRVLVKNGEGNIACLHDLIANGIVEA